jgi:hypothetical protein
MLPCVQSIHSITVDPATQLFRMNFPGGTTGPLVSQFLLQPFVYDGITVQPRTKVGMPGMDYMTVSNCLLLILVLLSSQVCALLQLRAESALVERRAYTAGCKRVQLQQQP